MEIGISTACFYSDYYTENAVYELGKSGIKTVEVFLQSSREYENDFCEGIAKHLNIFGMKAVSVHLLTTQFEPQLFARSKRQREDAQSILIKALKSASNFSPNTYTFHGTAIRRGSMPYVNFSALAEPLTELLNICNNYGIKLAWENVSWGLYENPQFAREIIVNTKSDDVYFTLDIKQALKSGHDPIEYAKIMDKRLMNVHLCDLDENGYPCLPGKGVYDFHKFANCLKSINYKGPLILEVYRSNFSDMDELLETVDNLKIIFNDI